MINEEVKKVYLSQTALKVFSGGVLLALIGCMLTWVKIEGFAVFFATEIVKLVENLKIITITVSIVSALWAWGGLVMQEKNIRLVSISSILVILVFLYMALSVYQSENIKEDNKIISAVVLVIYGLLYIIPLLMALKNNFKCLYMNINLTLFFIFVCQLYVLQKFSDSAVKAMGIILQYSFHVAIVGVLTALFCSIILTVKLSRNTHHKKPGQENDNPINSEEQS